MTLAAAIMGDWAVMDGTAAVTLTPSGSGSADAVAHALSRQITNKEAAESNGAYVIGDLVWSLPVEEVSVAPKPRDTITEADGTIWTIIAVDRATLRTRYRCWCKRYRLEDLLDTTVDIELGTAVSGVRGQVTFTYTTAYASVAARIQPISMTAEAEAERRILAPTHMIYLGSAVTVDARHRIKHGSTYYRLVSVKGQESLNGLTVLEVAKQ